MEQVQLFVGREGVHMLDTVPFQKRAMVFSFSGWYSLQSGLSICLQVPEEGFGASSLTRFR